VLWFQDENCERYVETYKSSEGETPKGAADKKNSQGLCEIIEKGLKEEALDATVGLLERLEPLEIINGYIIPALDSVGDKYEKGDIFLPQLIQSAETVRNAFAAIKNKISAASEAEMNKGRIVLATVKGDVHDIGKNIVKVLLESYGFEVIDLGKDVPKETILREVMEKDVRLVGLSALMTTTVCNMEETINHLKESCPDCKVMVGGAVLNESYAESIGADYYGRDAKESVNIANRIFGIN